MTKHLPSEEVLKCTIGLEEGDKVGTCVPNLLEKNAIAIGNARVNLPEENRVEIPLVRARKSMKKSRLGKVTEKLYDLEPPGISDKPLNVDLGLYQMEDY